MSKKWAQHFANVPEDVSKIADLLPAMIAEARHNAKKAGYAPGTYWGVSVDKEFAEERSVVTVRVVINVGDVSGS